MGCSAAAGCGEEADRNGDHGRKGERDERQRQRNHGTLGDQVYGLAHLVGEFVEEQAAPVAGIGALGVAGQLGALPRGQRGVGPLAQPPEPVRTVGGMRPIDS